MNKNQIEVEMVEETTPELTTENSITYVIIRDGLRVSDREYDSLENQDAIKEKQFWENISQKFSKKEKVEIVAYNPRKHRLW